MKHLHFVALWGMLLLVAGMLGGCASSANSSGNPISTDISINPTTQTLTVGDSYPFTATVSPALGSNNVTWTVLGGSSNGTVTPSTGLNVTYIAPITAGTYYLRVTSTANPAAYATAEIIVNSNI